jgi:hypothetical protein
VERRASFVIFLRVAALVMLLCAAPRPAMAGGTSPLLALSGAEVFRTSGGAVVLSVSGAYSFEDLVQLTFPAGLIVAQANRFVRYDVSRQIVSGTSALVSDGILDTEIPTLLTLGGPANTPAALLQAKQDRLSVVLPPEIASGPATAILYAIWETDPFVSNALPFVVP